MVERHAWVVLLAALLPSTATSEAQSMRSTEGAPVLLAPPADCGPCPGLDDICYEGECVFPCVGGDFPCPYGFYCELLPEEVCGVPGGDMYCLPDPCVDMTCPPGFVCIPDTGECIDLCEGVDCEPGLSCRAGYCFDCFDPTCPGWSYCCDECEVCVANQHGVGACEVDPCCNITCGEDEYCSEGECVSRLCDPPCDPDEICALGKCEPDPCADIVCGVWEICLAGKCICAGSHNPCCQVECPQGYVCEVGSDGTALCEQASPAPPAQDTDGLLGCAVRDHNTPTSAAIVLAIGGLALLLRRRRSAPRGRSR